MYTEELMKRFRHPKNAGTIKDADGVGEQGNIRCGDVMKLYIKVKNNRITDARFETFGCAAAIAASDVLCDVTKGKTLEEALKITKDNIMRPLGDLPPVKVHCSLLGVEALRDAIRDYRKKRRERIKGERGYIKYAQV